MKSLFEFIIESRHIEMSMEQLKQFMKNNFRDTEPRFLTKATNEQISRGYPEEILNTSAYILKLLKEGKFTSPYVKVIKKGYVRNRRDKHPDFEITIDIIQ